MTKSKKELLKIVNLYPITDRMMGIKFGIQRAVSSYDIESMKVDELERMFIHILSDMSYDILRMQADIIQRKKV